VQLLHQGKGKKREKKKLHISLSQILSPSFQAEELNKISSLFQGKKIDCKSNKPLVVVVCCCC
jgi:hypothetical protein